MKIKVEIRKLKAILVLLLVPLASYAWEYETETATTTQSAQWRMEAGFTKKWNNGLRLSFGEELRFDLYNSATGPAFRKSFTTLSLAYAPIQYFKLDAGYTLKVLGPDTTWSESKKADVNEYLRHRIFFSVTGSYKFDYDIRSLQPTQDCNTMEQRRTEKSAYLEPWHSSSTLLTSMRQLSLSSLSSGC